MDRNVIETEERIGEPKPITWREYEVGLDKMFRSVVGPKLSLEMTLLSKKIPRKEEVILSVKECRKMHLNTDNDLLVTKYGSLLATELVPNDCSKAVALALSLVPERVAKLLEVPKESESIPIIFTDGSLTVDKGKRLPALTSVDKTTRQPKLIKMSMENMRLSFGLGNKKSRLDSVISFAVAAHEISDWILTRNGAHDYIIDSISGTDSEVLATGHSESLSEMFSNKIAIDLTEETFGLTISLGENKKNIFTREPSV